ncbi:RimJ/RimL family protein N-acetyltransferase [Nocardioides cavernae]|uniref:RimJ/RimL family protein N-acetyltransferase n=1 Tax=Nocardioides cavernae TaxID=1921566 RepID=A0A7Y9H5C6_9ACTN|nr:GNAT family N-acetyltransferase [Nocardioides cavernae]NYE37539.1 RimJ/RimL family protein N-acetyltransferase [Nocardioides cavernae]
MGLPLIVDGWPPPPLRTERLVLRPPTAADRESFLDLAADPDVNRHLGGARDRDEMARTMPQVPADQPGQLVADLDGRFVGWVGLSRREPGRPGRSPVDGPALELSYLLPVSAWGHGYARESCAALLAWSDEHLGEPAVLCTQVANARSVALAGRLGFAEVERFEEFGAEQWFGVRPVGIVQ